MTEPDTLDRILADLRSDLEDPAGEPWPDVVEEAMNTAWDRLLKVAHDDRA